MYSWTAAFPAMVFHECVSCLLQTLRTEGPLALYKGFFPSYLRLGPWNIIVSYSSGMLGGQCMNKRAFVGHSTFLYLVPCLGMAHFCQDFVLTHHVRKVESHFLTTTPSQVNHHLKLQFNNYYYLQQPTRKLLTDLRVLTTDDR